MHIYAIDKPDYVPDGYPVGFTDNVNEAKAVYVKFTEIDGEFYKRHQNISCVLCPCTGVNHISKEEAQSVGVKVIYLDDEFKTGIGTRVTGTAEHTMRLMLNISQGKQLFGKSILILGHGRIGEMVKNYCYSFGMFVNTVDKNIAKKRVPSWVKQRDYVTIHLPESEVKYVDDEFLSAMMDGAYLINTARPEIVDKQALIKHLPRLGGYAVDFWDNDLSVYPNVLLTDHIGGKTVEGRKITDEYVFNEFLRRIPNENQNNSGRML
jgi:phosphoglycerate dehydrogenase-like enzyme